MMHIAIVEDFVFDQKHLIDLIQKNFEEHGEMADFTCYENGEAFLKAFRPGLFNAVFMDIMLAKNGLNGIETAEKLRTVAARIPLIFVSNERDYSLEGYRVHPLDYLLKPVDADALDWCSAPFFPNRLTLRFRLSLDRGSHPASGFFWMIFYTRKRRITA